MKEKNTLSSEPKKSENMLRTAGFMAIVTLLAKVCGLLRESLIAAYFSTGFEGNAYMAATQLPMTLFDLVIGGVISASFIPIFNDVMQKKSKAEAMNFANRFIGLIFTVCTVIAAGGMIFSKQLMQLMAPDFSPEALQLAATLSCIMFPMIIFTGLAFSFVGILQSFGEFNIPAVMSLLSNLCVIAYFPLFGKRYGVYGLSVAMLVSWSVQVLVQIPSLVRFSFRFRPRLTLRDPDILRAVKLAGPMLVSTWVQPLYSIVNTRIASGFDGGVAALNYANRLYIVVTGVFSFVVTNLVFPKLSRAASSEDKTESKKLLASSIKAVCLVMLPIAVLFFFLARPIIAFVYERGAFSAEDTALVSNALRFYSIGMVGLAINEVLSKAFFSQKDSKTPMLTAVCSMAVNIVLALSLSDVLGIAGLALAGAGGSISNALLNALAMHRKLRRAASSDEDRHIFTKCDGADFVKMLLSAALCAVPTYGLCRVLSEKVPSGMIGNFVLCAAAGAAGFVTYAAALLLMRESDLFALLKKGRKADRR